MTFDMKERRPTGGVLLNLCVQNQLIKLVMQFLPLALCLLGFFLSKIFLFLQPREFRGTIKYLNVAIEQKKKYLSGQAGLTYAATQHKVLDLVVEHKTGRSRSVTLPYRKAYEDLKIGDEVILLRFVDAVSPIS